jgi:hypothetical protein
MAKPSEAMQCRVVGRLGRAPEVASTTSGVAVCRLVVVKKAAGPASSPVRIGLYVKGELAKRCGRLGEGDLIAALGELGGQRRAAVRYPELLAQDVKLYERAGGGGLSAVPLRVWEA